VIWHVIFIGAGVGFLAHWLLPAIRKRIEFEIEAACAVACLWAAFYVYGVGGGGIAPLVHLPAGFSVAAVLLWFVSVGLFVVSLLSLRAFGKPTRGWEDTTRLSTVGIHRFVRHPMYLAIVLAAAAVILMRPAAAILSLGGGALVLGFLAARAEDKYDIAKFGDGYRAYMERVPRLNIVLGVWRGLAGVRRGRSPRGRHRG